jgi:cell division protein FtsW (lipid II flippase)
MPAVSSPEGQPSDADGSQRASAPGVVLAAAILLYVGGGLTVLSALTGLMSGTVGSLLRSGVYALLGLLYVGLARAVQRGRRWARRTVLVLCVLGIALAGIRLFGSSLSSAVGALVWPAIYAILLSTETARSWFRAGDLGPVR